VDGIGQPIDGGAFVPRESVSEPIVDGGWKAVDAQWELITGIGDQQTGKTMIAMDTIINQKTQKDPFPCFYCWCGTKAIDDC
jgi:F0F1-type ATP synthase alpha subunit